MKCYQCEKELDFKDVSMAQGLPDIGQFYWCKDCVPIGTPEEIIESLDDFIEPKKE
jgi:hypothetical protein